MREPGIYPVSEDEYHSDPALSCSSAKLLLKSPAKYLEEIVNPTPPTRTMDYGTLAHYELLGVGSPLVVLDPAIHGLTQKGEQSPSPRSTAMWKDAEAKARSAGALPVHVEDYSKAKQMAAAVVNDPIAGPLFAEGTPELSMWASDPRGVNLRARTDWMTFVDGRVWLVDYKTAEDADPRVWRRNAHKFGYHIQRAWYRRVAMLLEIDADPEFVFVVQEKKSPYLVSVIRLDQWACQLGEQEMDEAIATYRRCTEVNRWPGYGEQIHTVGFPPYVYSNTTPTTDEDEQP